MDGKTTEIYLIRHGESQANERDVFLGHGDLDLTEKGKKQAELTAEYLKACHFDVIYSSDLLRAYHTAEATAKKVGLPIVKDERLREIDAGEWDFKTFDDLEKEYQDKEKNYTNYFIFFEFVKEFVSSISHKHKFEGVVEDVYTFYSNSLDDYYNNTSEIGSVKES